MTVEEIASVGWLHNHNGSICLVVCGFFGHVFVTISRQEFDAAGGRDGFNADKQLAVDFYNEYGAGRP